MTGIGHAWTYVRLIAVQKPAFLVAHVSINTDVHSTAKKVLAYNACSICGRTFSWPVRSTPSTQYVSVLICEIDWLGWDRRVERACQLLSEQFRQVETNDGFSKWELVGIISASSRGCIAIEFPWRPSMKEWLHFQVSSSWVSVNIYSCLRIRERLYRTWTYASEVQMDGQPAV